jgi:hypothetical protein
MKYPIQVEIANMLVPGANLVIQLLCHEHITNESSNKDAT